VRRTISLPRALRLLIVSLACGCGEPEAPQEQSSLFTRLELEAVDGALAAPEVKLLSSLGDLGGGTDCSNWSLDGPNFEFLEPDSGRVLKVGRSRAGYIAIPSSQRFEGACEVTVRLISRVQPFELTGRVISKGDVLGWASARVRPWKNQQEIKLHFETQDTGGRSIDHLVLGFSPGVEPTFLYSVEIRDVMPGGRLPAAAFGGWELVEIGTDARRSTFLAPGRLLRARHKVSALGEGLRFSQVSPEVFHEVNGGAPLRLSISGEAVEPSTFISRLGPGDAPAWYDSSISLDPWLGQEITLDFILDPEAVGYRALSQPTITSESAAPKTVALITSDTHRADHLGFLFADGELRTDALDALAERGVVFSNAVASINNTTPSHVALMTGLSPRDTGAVANALPISEVAPTLAEAFRDQGYATLAAVSASPVSYRYSGLGQGFDRYSGPGARSARDSLETFRQLEEWLPEYGEAPLFLWLHIYDAHGPYAPPPAYRNLYYSKDLDPYAEREAVGEPRIPLWDRKLTDPDFAEALYRSEITYLDELLASFLARPRFQEAVIAFTSDHGETLTRGLEEPFGHLSLTYNTLAIPLILAAPGLAAGEMREAPVQQLDVGRTLLNLAGHPGVEFPGEDLLRAEGARSRPRFGVQANGHGASILHGRWLLVLNLTGRQEDWGAPEETRHAVRLFDVQEDPYCERDVLTEHMNEAARLRISLLEWLGSGEQNDWLSEPNGSRLSIQRQLEELGYTDSAGTSSAGTWIDPECSCLRCEPFKQLR
jgi:arylsulfatase A-like enzyme